MRDGLVQRYTPCYYSRWRYRDAGIQTPLCSFCLPFMTNHLSLLSQTLFRSALFLLSIDLLYLKWSVAANFLRPSTLASPLSPAFWNWSPFVLQSHASFLLPWIWSYECQANQPCRKGSYYGGGLVVMCACFPAGRGGHSVSSAYVIFLGSENSREGKALPLPDKV